MSRFNSPKPNTAGRRCTVCGSSYHDRREHTADERLASRDVREAPALERKYLPKGMDKTCPVCGKRTDPRRYNGVVCSVKCARKLPAPPSAQRAHQAQQSVDPHTDTRRLSGV